MGKKTTAGTGHDWVDCKQKYKQYRNAEIQAIQKCRNTSNIVHHNFNAIGWAANKI